jgi:hypothetical protein
MNSLPGKRLSELHRAARRYTDRWRLHVLPLLAGGKEPHIRSAPGGCRDASSSPAEVDRWWRLAPRANIGIACGPSGIVVIDVDQNNGGDKTLAELTRKLGPLPPTWTARTAAGNLHYYLRHEGDDAMHSLGDGVDVQRAGYVVAPPSVDVLGQRYRWHVGAHPVERYLASVPLDWLDRMRIEPRRQRSTTSGLDARESFLGVAFNVLGWLGRPDANGTRRARCPWLEEHSDGLGNGEDASTVLFSPMLSACVGGFHCSHASCAERDVLDVVEMLPDHAVDAGARAFPKGYQLARRRLAARVADRDPE